MSQEAKNAEQKSPVELEVPSDIATVYSNFLRVSVTQNEYVLTFGLISPEDRREKVAKGLVRIFVSHNVMPRIIKALEHTKEAFEQEVMRKQAPSSAPRSRG